MQRARALANVAVNRATGPAGQWSGLVMLAAVLWGILLALGFPAALLLGPMLAAVAFGVGGARLAVPRPMFLFAQGIAGCLIARSLTPSILVEIIHDWPVILLAIALTLVFAALVGLSAGRAGRMPRDAAIWGFLPGMAGAMIAIAHEQKVDSRLVAFLQYVRLVVVIVAMSLVARFAIGEGAPAPLNDAGALSLPMAAATLTVAGLAFVGTRLRFLPAGSTLVPMVVAAVLQVSGTLDITLPGTVLSFAYAVIGFQVGLRFTRSTVLLLVRLIPAAIAGSVVLVALCALSAWLLTALLGIDPLTAFLGTVPGSIETVAIIAIASKADVSFVMALQTVRLFVVVLLGPPLARLACRVVA